MTNAEWSAPVRWDEACARSAGRRRINAVRRLRALVRQQAVLRRLRELGYFTRRGVQRQLAREFGVVPSVICMDIKRLFKGEHMPPAQTRRVPRPLEVHMPEKVFLRLSTALYKDLQQAAHSRGVSPSAVIRTAVQQFLGQPTPVGVPLTMPPGATWELVLARCPDDVQVAVRQAVDRTGLPVGEVMRALLVSAAGITDQSTRP